MLQLNVQHQLSHPSRSLLHHHDVLKFVRCLLFTPGFNARQQPLEFKWHASFAGKCECFAVASSSFLNICPEAQLLNIKTQRFEKLFNYGRSFWQQKSLLSDFSEVLSITDSHGQLSVADALQKNRWDRPQFDFQIFHKEGKPHECSWISIYIVVWR